MHDAVYDFAPRPHCSAVLLSDFTSWLVLKTKLATSVG